MKVEPIPLEGDTVRLEPLTSDHLEAMYRHSEPALYQHFLDWPDDPSYEAFQRWMQQKVAPSPTRISFATCLRETGEAVGTTSYLDISEYDRTLEIGSTWLSRKHQGTKVNPEAKLLMLQHAFESLGALRVQLQTSTENLQSQAAIAKLGAVREGVLRNHWMRKNGRPRDSVIFSITDAEWPKVKSGLHQRLGNDARQVLTRLLERHVPTDDKERKDREQMLRYARELQAPFSRAQQDAHFTGSAVVVSPDHERVCLIHHGKLNRWLQPGGHSDPQDFGLMELTALREAREETGLRVILPPKSPRPLDVDIHAIPERKGEPGHLHLDVRFVVQAENPDALAHDPAESHGARWLPWDEALRGADEPALRRLLEKARAAR